MTDRDSEFEAWVERARQADIQVVAERLGAKLKKITSTEIAGPCPRCAGDDRFAINVRDRIFNCRGSGDGGDVINLYGHVKGLDPKRDFVEICEAINGEPPPGRDRREISPEEARARQERREAEDLARETARKAREAADSKRRESVRAEAERLFNSAGPIRGSHAEAYLHARGIPFSSRWTGDLRFLPSLTYFGYAKPVANQEEKDDRLVDLGAYPCMIAAIRSASGDMIALHRTYLDPHKPQKLRPLGDTDRNKAKKVRGSAKGGMIWLADPHADRCLVGEGMESVFSADIMGIGRASDRDDGPMALIAGYSLGNLAGRCTDSIPHPSIPKLTIPNGIPDLAEVGIILPEHIKHVTLIGDGDSDWAKTCMSLIAAGKRFQHQGKTVSVNLAPAGTDHNNLLTGSTTG